MPSRCPQPKLPSPTDGFELVTPKSLAPVPSSLLTPSPPPPLLTVARIVLLSSPFALGKSRLTPVGHRDLDEAAQQLHNPPNLSVALDGFSDAVGTDGQTRPIADMQGGRARNRQVDLKVLVRYAGGRILRVSRAAGGLGCV